jgi:hypothetical protein
MAFNDSAPLNGTLNGKHINDTGTVNITVPATSFGRPRSLST